MAAQLDLSAGQGASLEAGSEHKNTKSTKTQKAQKAQKAQMQKQEDARPSASSRKGIVLSSNYKNLKQAFVSQTENCRLNVDHFSLGLPHQRLAY